MVSTLNVIFNFISMVTNDWPFGRVYCKISQFVAVISICGSVFTLMAISIERWVISFEYLIIVNGVSVLLRIRRRKQKSAVVFEFGLVEVRRLSDTHVFTRTKNIWVQTRREASTLEHSPVKTRDATWDDFFLLATAKPSRNHNIGPLSLTESINPLFWASLETLWCLFKNVFVLNEFDLLGRRHPLTKNLSSFLTAFRRNPHAIMEAVKRRDCAYNFAILRIISLSFSCIMFGEQIPIFNI